jgi:type I restriction enzyme R subunit
MPPGQCGGRFQLAAGAGVFFGGHSGGANGDSQETKYVSNIDYFGEPVYTYSLRQGIEDGFLAPFKVVRVDLDKDLEGWQPEDGEVDDQGQLIEDRLYNLRDYDRTIVFNRRTELVAQYVSEFLHDGDPMRKTIIFCEDIDHAQRMRQALVNVDANRELVQQDRRYVMQITGDEKEGKAQLDHFINPNEPYPVIATTSKLMTTGVDAQTCHVIMCWNDALVDDGVQADHWAGYPPAARLRQKLLHYHRFPGGDPAV